MVNTSLDCWEFSGTSSDVRDLLARESRDHRAADAVALLLSSEEMDRLLRRALGGLDTLVFAGGIGANSPIIRARICHGLDFLGVKLSVARNGNHAALISSGSSRVRYGHPH